MKHYASTPRHARIQEFSSGGSRSADKKRLWQRFFFFFFFLFCPQLILQKSNGQFQRNIPFFNVPEGVQHFTRGGVQLFPGGVQLLTPFRNPYNLWFSRRVRTPCPPPLDPHLHRVQKWQTQLDLLFTNVSAPVNRVKGMPPTPPIGKADHDLVYIEVN